VRRQGPPADHRRARARDAWRPRLPADAAARAARGHPQVRQRRCRGGQGRPDGRWRQQGAGYLRRPARGGRHPRRRQRLKSPGRGTRPGRSMLTLADIGFAAPTALLARYGLALVRVADGAPIPGSYWGECEAGIIGTDVYARDDTPVHSMLHEACHLIVLPPECRTAVHTDATDSIEEEDAVCVLQALLGDELPAVGRERVLADMDAWGYTF